MDTSKDFNSGHTMTESPVIERSYLWMLFGRLMPLLALFVITIIYSHHLSLDEYSQFQSLWMYSNVVSVIIGFGITTLIFSTPPGILLIIFRRNRKQILGLYFILWASVLLLFVVVVKQYALVLKLWVILFIILQVTNNIVESALIKKGGSNTYFLINSGYTLLFLIWHLVVLNSGFNLEYLIKGILCFSILKLLSLISIRDRSIRGHNKMLPEKKDFYAHWVYNGINDTLGVFAKWIDKLILIYLLTPSDFAIFFNGSVEIPFFSIFISVTGGYMMMQMAKNHSDPSFIGNIFKENFLILSSVVLPLFFFLMFFRYSVFLTFFGEKYLASLPVFEITILILPLRINHFGGVLQVFGKGKIVTQGALLDLIIAILMVIILYPLYGMQGAAGAIVISTLIQISYYLFHISRLLRVSVIHLIPFKDLLIRFAIIGFAFGILRMLSSDSRPILHIILGCLLIAVCTIVAGRKYWLHFRLKE